MPTYPYVSTFIDNRGRRRWRFRRRGRSVYLPGPPGAPEFEAAYAAALSGDPRPSGAGAAAKPGTVAALAAAYYRSPEYLALAASTRRGYRSWIDAFCAEHGEKRVATLPRAWVRAEIAARAGRPAAANRFLRYIRMLMNFAVREGWRGDSPCAGLRRMRNRDDSGYRAWGAAEIAAYRKRWPVGTKQRLAFDLMLYTGQRRSDIVRMSVNHISGEGRDRSIRVRQQKSGAALSIQLHPALAASIEATPRRGLALVETHDARPYSSKGFGGRFVAWARAAGVPKGYSAHGVRKAAGVLLAEAGATTRQIMAILGHKSIVEAERYTDAADQRRLARAGIGLLDPNRPAEPSARKPERTGRERKIV